VLVLVCALVLPANAQPKKAGDKATAAAASDKSDAKADKPGAKAKKPKEQNFDFNALDLNGRMRTPQLLYFLERANEELERASLEKRSFIRHMVRSVDEEAL
jgi:hypothetical protein